MKTYWVNVWQAESGPHYLGAVQWRSRELAAEGPKDPELLYRIKVTLKPDPEWLAAK